MKYSVVNFVERFVRNVPQICEIDSLINAVSLCFGTNLKTSHWKLRSFINYCRPFIQFSTNHFPRERFKKMSTIKRHGPWNLWKNFIVCLLRIVAWKIFQTLVEISYRSINKRYFHYRTPVLYARFQWNDDLYHCCFEKTGKINRLRVSDYTCAHTPQT